MTVVVRCSGLALVLVLLVWTGTARARGVLAECLAPYSVKLELPYFPAVFPRCTVISEQPPVAALSLGYETWRPGSQPLDYPAFQVAARTAMFAHVDGSLRAQGFTRDIDPRNDHPFGAQAAEYRRDDVRVIVSAGGQGAELRLERSLRGTAIAELPDPLGADNYHDADEVGRLFVLPGGQVLSAGWVGDGNTPFDHHAFEPGRWITPHRWTASGGSFIGIGRFLQIGYQGSHGEVTARYRESLASAGWQMTVAEGHHAVAGSVGVDQREVRFSMSISAEGGSTIVRLHTFDPWYAQRRQLVSGPLQSRGSYSFTPTFDPSGRAHPQTELQMKLVREIVLEDADDNDHPQRAGIAVFPALAESHRDDPAALDRAQIAQSWAADWLVASGVSPDRMRRYDSPIIAERVDNGFEAGVGMRLYVCWNEQEERDDGPVIVCRCGQNPFRPPWGSSDGECP